MHTCITSVPSNMHKPSAAAEPERPSNRSFPNRHNGDFRYVKLQKESPGTKASRALRG